MISEVLQPEAHSGSTADAGTPGISLLVCTYNRAARLRELLASLEAQVVAGQPEPAAEVIVVDNNSRDSTRRDVADFAATSKWPVRYLLEERQGKSYALNSALSAARAELCLVLDDDQRMPADYLEKLLALFQERPDLSFAGGRVLPLWEAPPPAWLGPDFWSPLGMSDYGAESFEVNRDRLVCLLTFAFRKADVERVGGFRSELGLFAGWPGSTEDAELIRRLVAAGRPGRYVPDLVLEHHAPAARLTASYYRRWYRGHGRYLALDDDPAVETTRFRFAGIPGHMVRAAGRDLLAAFVSLVRGEGASAFRHELQLHQFAGFAWQRLRERWPSRRRPTRD